MPGGLVVAAALLVLGAPRPPLAQSLPPDARRDYDAGKLLFEDGDFATALLKYRDAYERTHDARLLWNVAVCQKNLRHYAKARATLARYLGEGGDLLSAADRHDALELSKVLALFTVPMTFDVQPAGADVWIDDEHVGTAPLAEPVTLDMGARRVRVRKDGYRLYERDVPVGGSAATSVQITLEKLSGRLELTVPAYATVFIDEKEVGRGPHVALDLPAGAHALRVVAPHMRPMQTDVVVEDGKSRSLDVPLEREAAPSAEVHIAVRCHGPDPLPQQAVSVFFDDATESALPLGVRMRRDPNREVVAYVPYRVPPGKHTVHVASQRCEGADTVVDVPEGGVVEVTGELTPTNGWLESSPAGSPDGWRVSAGLMDTSTTFQDYYGFFATSNTTGTLPTNVAITQYGPVADAGFHGRWLSALLEARFQLGRTSNLSASNYAATLSQWSIGVKPGVRLPLVILALSTGVGFHMGQYFFSPDSAGPPQSGLYYDFQYWAAVDAQPFCDWGLQLGISTNSDGYASAGSIGGSQGSGSAWVHATYTPNAMCERRRAGEFRIRTTEQ